MSAVKSTAKVQRKYTIVKRITDGSLRGMRITEQTDVPFRAGEIITAGAWTGPGYVVESVEVQS